MKFAIASVSYWDSIGMDSTKWRKSLDGTKALCHLSYAERLGINLHATPEVAIYDNVDTEFEDLLSSPEWSETSATGDPDSFSILNELNQFETNINNAVSQKTADLTAQLQQTMYNDNYLTRKLKNKESVDVFLCGNSITAGVGSAGYNFTSNVILTEGSNTYYEPNHTSLSWANRFRNFITSQNENNTFFNGGIGGKYVSFFNRHRTTYISSPKDVIFVSLGTNERGQYETVDGFKTDLTDYLAYVQSMCNFMVVMSDSPIDTFYDTQGNFTQAQGASVVAEVCKENGYLFVDNFHGVLERMFLKDLRAVDILSDEAHPNDTGHLLIWDSIKSKLGLQDTLDTYKDITNQPVILSKYGTYTKDTLATDFPKGSLIYSLVSRADASGYPENNAGMLITDTTSKNESYYYQIYHVYNLNRTYKRIVNATTFVWGKFEPIAGFSVLSNNAILNDDTPLTNFNGNQMILNTVSSVTGIPTARAGTLETILAHATSGQYAYQRYYPYTRNTAFSRAAAITGDGWQPWGQQTRNQSMQSFTQAVGTVSANSTKDIDLTIAGGVDSNFMHMVTIESAIANGVTWCGFKKSGTVYTVRFHNTTASDVNVGSVLIKYVTLETVTF